MKVKLVDDWHEDHIGCLFFHFDNYGEPPDITASTPLDSDFDCTYWTHFIEDFDFNELIEQAILIDPYLKAGA